MAKSEQVRVDLVAEDKASKDIDKVADKVEDLEDAKVEIPVTADTDQAERAIEGLSDEAMALSRADAQIVLRAKIDQASAELKALRDDLEQTSDKARDTATQLDKVDGPGTGGGIGTRGNAIADLAGPLGEAEGAASTFAGVFEGLGDIAGDVTTKLGGSQDMAAKVQGALGGLGIAAAGAAALWSIYTSRQEAARKKAEETAKAIREINTALEEGDVRKAGEQFAETFGDVLEQATKAGIKVGDFTDYVRGLSDTIPGATAEINAARTAQEQLATTMGGVARAALTDAQQAWLDLGYQLDGARDSFADTEAATQAEKEMLGQLMGSLQGAEKDTKDLGTAQRDVADDIDYTGQRMDALRGKLDFEQAVLTFQTNFSTANTKIQEGTALTAQEILDLKSDYLGVADEIGKTPVEIRSDLKKIESGDIATVLYTAQAGINARPPLTVSAKIALEKTAIVVTGAGGGNYTIGGASAQMAPAEVVNVYQTVPRGYHGDVLTDARAAARRAGGLYRRSRR